MPYNHLILCCPLLLLPSVFPSIRVFSSESVLCNRWPKYWSFSLSIRPSNEYSGLIFFRIDWFDLIAVQRNLRSLLQHHRSKASIIWDSRGITPRPRWGAAAKNARLQRCRNGREELPKSEARGCGWEDQPHAQGQGRRPGGPTPHPRSSGCPGAGGPKGAIPCWRSGRAVVRRYPSSKVRSSGCALLEQPWRATPRPR